MEFFFTVFWRYYSPIRALRQKNCLAKNFFTNESVLGLSCSYYDKTANMNMKKCCPMNLCQLYLLHALLCLKSYSSVARMLLLGGV